MSKYSKYLEKKSRFKIIACENSINMYLYEKKIAVVFTDSEEVWLDATYWNFSKTTTKYRNIFLGERLSQTHKKIRNGLYKLTNLN